MEIVCFWMRNCPHAMPQGGEGLTEWSRQLQANEAQAWYKVFSELGHHTFPSLMHRNLPRTETATLTTGGAGTLRETQWEKGTGIGMSILYTLEIHRAQCLAYEKPSINVGGAILRFFGGLCA